MDAVPTIPALGTILGVWAHPDDEAYLSAGLMALARQHGNRVVVVTATLGEAGTDDPAAWPPEELARHRRGELAAALAAVGVHEHQWLGYVDGSCDDIAHDEGVAAVAAVLDAVRPDTIVTFGPEGMTGHPDHRAVSRWTTAAWSATGGPARLWYATLTPEFHDRWGALNDEVGLWSAGPPPVTAAGDLAAEIHLDGAVLDRKMAALRAHRSQTAPLEAAVGSARYRAWWAVESFRAAARRRTTPVGTLPAVTERSIP
jgi:LmbE family N-acetylglucosaminyl deacetylase